MPLIFPFLFAPVLAAEVAPRPPTPPVEVAAPAPAGAAPSPVYPGPKSMPVPSPDERAEARTPGPPLDPDEARQRDVRVFGEVFARYGHERWGEQAARSFDLPRARLGADAALSEIFAARLLIETVRSAAPGSLYGVDGDSIVLRAREVYGEARTPEDWPAGLRLRLGLVPTLAITPLEQLWSRRVVAPTTQEASGLMTPADLGAAALVNLPHRLGEVALAATNGEGFTQHEQNKGKTVQARLWLSPLDALLPHDLSVKLLVHAESGSQGPTQARADRYVGALAVEHTRGAVGVDGTFANGVGGNSDQRARTVAAWLRLGPVEGFSLLGRYDQIDPDRRQNGSNDRVSIWQGGVGYQATLKRRPPGRAFETYLTYRSASGGPLAAAADPRLPQRGLRLDLRVAF